MLRRSNLTKNKLPAFNNLSITTGVGAQSVNCPKPSCPFTQVLWSIRSIPGEVAVLSRRRVDLLVGQGQLLLEVEAHGLVLLLPVAEGTDQLGVDLST